MDQQKKSKATTEKNEGIRSIVSPERKRQLTNPSGQKEVGNKSIYIYNKENV